MKQILNKIASIIALVFGVALVSLFAAVLYFKVNPPQVVAMKPSIAPVTYVHDPTLYPVLQSVAKNKADVSNISISYTDKAYLDATGDYKEGTDSIEMTHNADSTLPTVIAHEYLHHVYRNLSSTDKIAIDSAAIQHFTTDGGIRQRMQWYVDHNNLTANEIISVSCTEESDSWLSPALLSYCNKYIDRSQITLIH